MNMKEMKEERIAVLLAGGAVLDWRVLPDGGMCVIAADGRKLWFDPQQVGAAAERVGDGPHLRRGRHG
jgi:hypothetical protein